MLKGPTEHEYKADTFGKQNETHLKQNLTHLKASKSCLIMFENIISSLGETLNGLVFPAGLPCLCNTQWSDDTLQITTLIIAHKENSYFLQPI